jgi:imidazolonepropionase-like amidohydrolase
VTKLLIDSCEFVVTMDDDWTEIPGGSILVDDGRIEWVGSGRPPGAEGAEYADEDVIAAEGRRLGRMIASRT